MINVWIPHPLIPLISAPFWNLQSNIHTYLHTVILIYGHQYFFLSCVLHVKNITFFGVPKTWQILNMVSTSLEPGKRGLRV